MKKLIYAILIFMCVPFFNSCTKKSANDPLISLISRDARITGEWKLMSWESTVTITSSSSGSSNSSTSISNYNGTLVTYVNGNTASTYTYSSSVEISNDGTYTFTVIDSGDTVISTGEWWWLDNNKKKTRIAFDDDYSSWNIDKLGNKTLIVVDNSSYEEIDSDGDTYVSTRNDTYTYEKQ